jgi:hypothetical protein
VLAFAAEGAEQCFFARRAFSVGHVVVPGYAN